MLNGPEEYRRVVHGRMTEQPHFLPARPDPLADVLRAVKLTGAHFQCDDAGPPRVVRATGQHIACHILLSGTRWAGSDERAMVRMQPGDVMLLPHADASMPSTRGNDAQVVTGVFVCDVAHLNPLMASLPRQLLVTGAGAGWLPQLAGQLVTATRATSTGSATVLTRMAELMLTEILRRYAEQQPASRSGWLAGLTDPVVGCALTRLHARPAYGWTLAELARESASSRSVLTERFARLVGMPPMCYLKRWRLQLAAEQLTAGAAKVACVGARVGYESEAAFSRAFKQETGMSPAAWRRAGTER